MGGQKPVSISKKHLFPEYGYESLREEGLRGVQDLCGKRWTDFNPHDPGVTILEQIAFALSELGYKTQFDIQDYLAGMGGEGDYSAQGLFPPEIAFPGNPVTAEDYAKFLYTNIPEIENITVKYDDEKGYVLRIVPSAIISGSDQKVPAENHLIKLVKSFWEKSRNLGDVIGEINFDWKKICYLDGEIEIGGRRPVADILADINLLCSRHFGSHIETVRYDSEIVQKFSLETIFDGPLSSIGFLKKENFSDNGKFLYLSELEKVVQGIPGILNIHSLFLKGTDGLLLDDVDRSRLQLDFEKSLKHLRFFLGKRKLPLPDISALNRIGNLTAKRLETSRIPCPFRELRKLLPELPKGVHREINEYFSMVNQFPSLYGEKNVVGELQSYLSPLESLFKDFLQKLDGFGELFSIHGKFSNLGRINSVLNQMLAIYGCRFPDALFLALRGLSSEEIPLELIQAKRRCLQEWPDISKQRGGLRALHRIGMMIGVDFDGLSSDSRPVLMDGSCWKEFENQALIIWPIKSPYMNLETNRLAISEFICDEMPAHLVPCIYWVDGMEMQKFQYLYLQWKRSKVENSDALTHLGVWFRNHKNSLSGYSWV